MEGEKTSRNERARMPRIILPLDLEEFEEFELYDTLERIVL